MMKNKLLTYIFNGIFIILMNTYSSQAMQSQTTTVENRETIQDDQGKTFLIYKSSPAGHKCGFRIFNITPQEMVDQLMAHLNDQIQYLDFGFGLVIEKKTIREVVLHDMGRSNATDADIRQHLEQEFIHVPENKGELTEALIPAIAYIKGYNTTYYAKYPGESTIRLRYKFVKPRAPSITFCNNGRGHYDRLIPLDPGLRAKITPQELQAAEFSDNVYWFFNEHQYDIKDLNQLIPDELPMEIRNEAPGYLIMEMVHAQNCKHLHNNIEKNADFLIMTSKLLKDPALMKDYQGTLNEIERFVNPINDVYAGFVSQNQCSTTYLQAKAIFPFLKKKIETMIMEAAKGDESKFQKRDRNLAILEATNWD